VAGGLGWWGGGVARETNDRNATNRILNGIADVHRATHRSYEALAHYHEALTAALQTDDLLQQVRTHNGLAHAHHELGHHDKAHYHTGQSARLLAELDIPKRIPLRYRFLKRRQPETARRTNPRPGRPTLAPRRRVNRPLWTSRRREKPCRASTRTPRHPPGADVRFTKTSRALADLAGGHADHTWPRRLAELTRPDVLILDLSRTRDYPGGLPGGALERRW
jgi:hypothetical protein